MELAIFTPIDNLKTGGNYRFLRVIIRFPQDKFLLFMPRNSKNKLINDIKSSSTGISPDEKDKLLKVLSDALELKDLKVGILNYVSYGKYVAETAREYKVSLLYLPHEHAYFPIGFKASHIKWTELLQSTPVVGALSIEDGNGFQLFYRNLRNNYNYGLIKVVRSYLRFKLFQYATNGVTLLAVSASIPYELSRLGVNVNIKVLNPGIGVDPCPYASNRDRDIDVIFFARITPEKGIFDYLSIVSKLIKMVPNLKVAVMGFASDDMKTRVLSKAAELGIRDRVEFIFNASRDDVLRNLSRSKIMIYPTKSDSFSLSVLEALSCGTPVIAYAIPAIRLNYNTDAVIKVRPGNIHDAINSAYIVLTKGLWMELGKSGFNFSQKYNWDTVAKTEWNALFSLF